MNAENVVTERPPVIEETVLRSTTGKTNAIFWWHSIVFLICLALFVFLLLNIGFATLGELISRIGWGFLWLVGFDGMRHLIRAFSMYLAIPAEFRTFKFRYAFAARMGGEAVNVLTFTGPVLGEFTKATLLNNKISTRKIGAAIAVENLIFYASVALLILSGIIGMKWFFEPKSHMRAFLFGAAAIDMLFIYGLILLFTRQAKPLSWLLGKLAGFLPKFVANKAESIRILENNVNNFLRNHPKTFLIIGAICLLTHFISVFEVYFALQMLGFSSTLTASFVIESLTKVVNSAFTFVPGTIGVYEGGNGIILKAVGQTAAIGVALALVRRGATLFWTFLGLVILLRGGIIRPKQFNPISNTTS